MEHEASDSAVSGPAPHGTLALVLPLAQARWLEAFWFGTARKKHGGELTLSEAEAPVPAPSASASKPPPPPPLLLHVRAPLVDGETDAAFAERWTKTVNATLKKVETDDLGDMDARYLSEAIPEEGLAKLRSLEQELSVKVVFCAASGHILLAGAKAKLAKKCFELKNVLAHYHWRLSGHDRLLKLDQK